MSAKIPKEDIRSGYQTPPTVTSFPRNNSKPSEPYFVKIGGEVYVVEKTVYRMNVQPLSEFKKYGSINQLDDYRIKEWIEGGGPPAEHEYVRLPRKTTKSGMSQAFRERDLRMEHPTDTQVRLYLHDVYITEGYRNNEVGIGVSKIENSRQRLTNYFGTKIAQALAEKAAKSGKTLEEISYIGVGFLPENAIAGVTRTDDGKVAYIDSEGAYNKILNQAKILSKILGIYIDPEALLETIIAEEHEHIIRRSYDNPKIKRVAGVVAEERATKDLVYRAFLDLEKNAEGGYSNPKNAELRARYRIQAKIKEMDRDTTKERYSKAPGPYQMFYLEDKGEYVDLGNIKPADATLEQAINQTLGEQSARPALRLIKGEKYEKYESKETYEKPNISEYKSMDDVKNSGKEIKEKRVKGEKEAPQDSDEGTDGSSAESGESSMPKAA